MAEPELLLAEDQDFYNDPSDQISHNDAPTIDRKEPPRFYLSSVQKPTNIINITTGSLSMQDTLNAVVVRNQSIEICKIGHDGLKSLCMHQIFGTIIFTRLVKLPKEDVHSIFVVTERYDIMLLEYVEELNSLKT